MSALGHKQTFAVQNVMSALPPKADMCSAQARYVRFGPIADIVGLFDHIVSLVGTRRVMTTGVGRL